MNPFAEYRFGRSENPMLERMLTDFGGLPPCAGLINYLHEEMRQCYLECLNHAAVLVANSLLEATLRTAIHHKKNPKIGEPDLKLVAELEEKRDLGDLLSCAKTLGLLTKEEAKALDKGRDEIRNAYQHGKFPKAVREALPFPAEQLDLRTGERRNTMLDPQKNIFVRPALLMSYDRRAMPAWVIQLDHVVRKLMKPLIEKAQRGELGGWTTQLPPEQTGNPRNPETP